MTLAVTKWYWHHRLPERLNTVSQDKSYRKLFWLRYKKGISMQRWRWRSAGLYNVNCWLICVNWTKPGQRRTNCRKIHAKNEEIVIMRKKRTATVHALSHVREKLQFVEKDTKIVAHRLDDVEQGLHQGRIDLHNLKSRCEHISQKRQRLQKSMVNISDPLLLDDLEYLKDDAEATEELIAELRQRYDAVNREVRAQTKYMNSRRRAEKKAAEAETESNLTVAVMHNLRWGEERNMVGRQKM